MEQSLIIKEIKEDLNRANAKLTELIEKGAPKKEIMEATKDRDAIEIYFIKTVNGIDPFRAEAQAERERLMEEYKSHRETGNTYTTHAVSLLKKLLRRADGNVIRFPETHPTVYLSSHGTCFSVSHISLDVSLDIVGMWGSYQYYNSETTYLQILTADVEGIEEIVGNAMSLYENDGADFKSQHARTGDDTGREAEEFARERNGNYGMR